MFFKIIKIFIGFNMCSIIFLGCIKKKPVSVEVTVLDSHNNLPIKDMEIEASDCSQFASGIYYYSKTNEQGKAIVTVDCYKEHQCIWFIANNHRNYPAQKDTSALFYNGFVYASGQGQVKGAEEIKNGRTLMVTRIPIP